MVLTRLLLDLATWSYLLVAIEMEHFLSFVALLAALRLIYVLECFHADLLDGLVGAISSLSAFRVRSKFELIINICSLSCDRSNRTGRCLLISKVVVEFSMRFQNTLRSLINFPLASIFIGHFCALNPAIDPSCSCETTSTLHWIINIKVRIIPNTNIASSCNLSIIPC